MARDIERHRVHERRLRLGTRAGGEGALCADSVGRPVRDRQEAARARGSGGHAADATWRRAPHREPRPPRNVVRCGAKGASREEGPAHRLLGLAHALLALAHVLGSLRDVVDAIALFFPRIDAVDSPVLRFDQAFSHEPGAYGQEARHGGAFIIVTARRSVQGGARGESRRRPAHGTGWIPRGWEPATHENRVGWFSAPTASTSVGGTGARYVASAPSSAAPRPTGIICVKCGPRTPGPRTRNLPHLPSPVGRCLRIVWGLRTLPSPSRPVTGRTGRCWTRATHRAHSCVPRGATAPPPRFRATFPMDSFSARAPPPPSILTVRAATRHFSTLLVVQPGVDTCFTVAGGVARRCCAHGLLACPWRMHQRDDGKVLSVLAALPNDPGDGGGSRGGVAELEARIRGALARLSLARDPQCLPLDDVLPSLGPGPGTFSILEDVFLPLAHFSVLCALQRSMATPPRVLHDACLAATEDSQCLGLRLEAVTARPHGEDEVTLSMLVHPHAPRLILWRADAAEMAAAEKAWRAASAEARPLHGYLRRLEHGSLLSTMQCGVAVTGLVEVPHVAIPGLGVDARRALQARAAARGHSLNEARSPEEARAAWAALSGLPASALAAPLVWTVRLAGGEPAEMDLVPQALLLRAVSSDTRRRWEALPVFDSMVGALRGAVAACGFHVVEDCRPQDLGQSAGATTTVLACAASLCPKETETRAKPPGLRAPVLARRKERPLPVAAKAPVGAPAKRARPAQPQAPAALARGTSSCQDPRPAAPVKPAREHEVGSRRNGTDQLHLGRTTLHQAPSRVDAASRAPNERSACADAAPNTGPPRATKPTAPAKPVGAAAKAPKQSAVSDLEEGYRRELMKLRVPDLKKLCSAMAVKKGGRKGDLVERLAAAMAASAGTGASV